MKSHFLALAFVAAAALAPFAARADDEVSVETFYDNLAPYGEWIEVGDYGDCWHPTGVDADWAPYTDGYWSYTDAGWTWVSYEDFGDITYHYGRWVSVNDVGWCWVPDEEWGPAWVSWRQDDEYVGWAPLPPEAHWRQNVGFSTWVDDSYDIGPEYYNFCPIVEFSAPVIRHVCVPRVTVVSIFARSANITNISWNGYGHHVFCGGPSFALYAGRVHRPIPALKLVHNTTIINNNVTIINNRRVVKFPRGQVAGNTLNVFAPKVVKKDITNINRPHIARTVQKDQVNRGWKLQDQGEVAKLRQKVKSDNKGLTPDTAPAKPVQVADLKPVPEKADPKGPSPVAGRGDRGGRDRQGSDNKPDRAVADRPARGGAGNENRPDRPGRADGQRPDRGPDAGDQPDRPGAGKGNPKKIAGEDDNRPARDTGGNPVVRPFNEPRGEGRPGAGQGMGKKQGGGADNDGPSQEERQRREAALAERQQQMAEQRAQRDRQVREQAAERQRAAAEARQRQMEAQRGGDDGGGERVRPQQPQRDPAERQQMQIERQQQLQQRAQEHQRELQAQRQQQLQRQFQQQQAQRQQQGGGGGQGKQQPAQGQGNGNGKGRQLTPEEKEVLRKQQGR